jgi:hypothetical protein
MSQYFSNFICVKSIIALSLILLQLFTTTEMGELFKLPVLIQHYFEHDEKDDHQSFFSFIKEHYAEMHAAANQNHSDQHKKLPFKVMDCGFFNSITATVPMIYIASEFPVTDCTSNITVKTTPSRYFHFLANIWQPPRV